MKGMEISPASYATVYWDTTSHDVYLLVNNLPTPPAISNTSSGHCWMVSQLILV